MGIDVHALNFLRYVAKKREFGRVATIGRQSLLVSRSELADALGIPRDETDFGLFCEALLKKHFGASSVDSYDYSDYEGATHVVDLGRPFVPERQYDTVIDCGTAEHIFDVCQVMKNLSSLCAPGGQLIHVLPANNFCGHGFWQFLPSHFSRSTRTRPDTEKQKSSWQIYAIRPSGSRSSSRKPGDAPKSHPPARCMSCAGRSS